MIGFKDVCIMRLLDDVKIICKEDESVTKINKDYFEVQIVERQEKKMGAEVHYVASLAYELDCSHEVDIRLDAWEYSTGVIEYQEQNAGPDHEVGYVNWG